MRGWAWLIGCAMIGCGLGATPARAREWALQVGPGWRLATSDDETTHRFGLAVGGHFIIDDFWQLGASGELFTVPVGEGGMGGGARLDVRWLFDVLTWVPFIEASIGFTGQIEADSDEVRFYAIALGSLGLDYRPERDWSVGIRVGGGAMFNAASVHAYVTRVDLQAIFHFD